MSGGTQHSGWDSYGPNSTPSASLERRLGFSGEYHSAATVATTETASFNGYGAFMLGTGADDAATKIFVNGGGMLTGPDLNEKVIYEISPASVQSTGGNIYVFKKK